MAGEPKGRMIVDDIVAAIETARDKVMSDEVKALSKMGIPKAMAYQMIATRYHQKVVNEEEEQLEPPTWPDLG
jgi:hypothetical protein